MKKYKSIFRNSYPSIPVGDHGPQTWMDPSWKYLREGIIKPNEYKAIKDIVDILHNNYAKFELQKFNKLFAPFKIQFETSLFDPTKRRLSNSIKSGSMDVKNYIIYIELFEESLNFINRSYGTFMNDFLVVLKHEIIHRLQFLNIKQEKERLKIAHKQSKSDKAYLSSKHEIMAWAWNIIEILRMLYTNEEIANQLRSGNIDSVMYNDYLTLFDKNSKQIRMLNKYMYKYLQ